MSLLKSPKHPWKEADMRDDHEIVYALIPHEKPLVASETYEEAWKLNEALYYAKGVDRGLPVDAKGSFMEVETKSIVVDALKKAEESNEYVLRVHEERGEQVECLIKLDESLGKLSSAKRVNNLEEEVASEEAALSGNAVDITIPPFKIKSLKLTF